MAAAAAPPAAITAAACLALPLLLMSAGPGTGWAWDIGNRGVVVFPAGMLVADLAGEGEHAGQRAGLHGHAHGCGKSPPVRTAMRMYGATTYPAPVGLHKKGAGKLSLRGANTFAGGVLLEGGELEISADANLGEAASTLTFAGGTLQISASSELPASRNVVVTTGSDAVFNVLADTTIKGPISGGGGLAKVGPAALVLEGASTYGGATRVLAGMLTGQWPGGSDLYAAISATVNFSNASGEKDTLGDVTGAGTFAKSGAGDLTLSGGAVSWSIFGGALVSSGDFGGNVIFEAAGSVFSFNKSGDQSLWPECWREAEGGFSRKVRGRWC